MRPSHPAPRRTLAAAFAVAMMCLLAACGSSSGPTGEAPVTRSASGADLTTEGYSAFQAWVALNQHIVHLVQVHGVTVAVYRGLGADCHHLGPNSDDLEVQAFRSICLGSFNQGLALIRLRACAVGTRGQRRSCFTGVLKTTTAGTLKLVSADNSVLQILGRGACYSMLASGLPLENRLLNTGNRLLSAEQAGDATVGAANAWASAFNTIILLQEREIARMIKDPKLGLASTGAGAPTTGKVLGVCQPAGASGSAGGSTPATSGGSTPATSGGSTPE